MSSAVDYAQFDGNVSGTRLHIHRGAGAPLAHIPVIDIFAGPGGLGEGFASLKSGTGSSVFRLALSLEKDPHAHRTLELRSLVRQFPSDCLPAEYLSHCKSPCGETRDTLFAKYPDEASRAREEAWCVEISDDNAATIEDRVRTALRRSQNWVLIGGPPCQAYSVVGRARRTKERKERIAHFESDPRHTLYKHYLRLIERWSPAVFVMENVKGLLSAQIGGERIFDAIRSDLCGSDDEGRPRYHVYPLSTSVLDWRTARSRDYVVRSEDFGVPQTRHRVILLGVRRDITRRPGMLHPTGGVVTVRQAIGDLPSLRSMVSAAGGGDSPGDWGSSCAGALQHCADGVPATVNRQMREAVHAILGAPALRTHATLTYRTPQAYAWWFRPSRLRRRLPNHSSRAHMPSDLRRYLFCSAFAEAMERSPRLRDFPETLLPAHENVANGQFDQFADRFRVQCWEEPSSTITSHIAKDGHYYIHPDPAQCRSLTVREAARLQTFPDDYLFEGNRTQQYHQVGNAVPPMLARQIAVVVAEILGRHPEAPRQEPPQ